MANSSDYGVLYILGLLGGCIVAKSETALKIAETLIADVNGVEFLESERPLTAIEETDRWVVQGRLAEDNALMCRRPVKIVINKKDAKILEFQIPAVVHKFP
jgi:hypothetical protein